MLFFNKRRELERQYYDWIRDGNIKDCPFSVITFMDAYELIDEEKVTKFLEIFGGEYENSDCN